MTIEQFVEARLSNPVFSLADLIKLAKDNELSTYETRKDLESYGFTQVRRIVGPTESQDLPIKKGQVVTIPKGTAVRSTYKGTHTAGRTYKVTVDHILSGHRSHGSHGEDVLHPPKVCWAGTGGYWSEADINDIPEAFED